MKKLQQKGAVGIIGVLVILAVITAIGATAFWVSGKSNNQKTDQPSTRADNQTETGNAEIDKMLAGIQYQKIASAPSSICSDDRNVCYDGETVLVKMSYPVPEKFKTVIANLSQNGWLMEEGMKPSYILENETIATSSQNPNTVPEKDLLFKEPNADKNYGYFSFLNLGLFGVKSTMYRGDEGAYFFAFSKSELQTNEEPYYILNSEVPGADSFNFSDVLAQLDDNSFILSITIGKKPNQ